MLDNHFCWWLVFWAAESRSARQELARVSNLPPRRKPPLSGEIANFPQVLCWLRTLVSKVSYPSGDHGDAVFVGHVD